MKILLTGFEPFGGSDINPSEQVVNAIGDRELVGVSLQTAVLPVDSALGPATLINALTSHSPDAVVCLGEAGGRPSISVERIFVNLMDYAIVDNDGRSFVDQSIAPHGPAAYFATLPVRAIHDAIQAAGIPVTLSLTAGAYLCNQVSYALLHHLTLNQIAVTAGFIHLPYLPQQAAKKQKVMPSMGLETMIRAVRIVIQTVAGK